MGDSNLKMSDQFSEKEIELYREIAFRSIDHVFGIQKWIFASLLSANAAALFWTLNVSKIPKSGIIAPAILFLSGMIISMMFIILYFHTNRKMVSDLLNLVRSYLEDPEKSFDIDSELQGIAHADRISDRLEYLIYASMMLFLGGCLCLGRSYF
jgi:hypothetical protein